MDKLHLKSLLIDQKERFISRKGLFPRDALRIASKFLERREIIVLTGVRRSGKSSLMHLLYDELITNREVSSSDILYLNFEDERLIDFNTGDFERITELFLEMGGTMGKAWFFLDEVQNAKGWEKWLNRLYESEDVRAVVTGSNASLLESDISSALTGRNRQITVYPLSFREYLAWKGVDVADPDLLKQEDRAAVRSAFSNYIVQGGFPEVVKTGDDTILEQYLKDILYRDVIARKSIRNAHEIKELCLFLASNLGSIRSYKNLKEMIGARSLVTVKNHLDIFEQVYLFFGLDIFDYSVKRRMYNPSKVYSIDAALSNTLAFRFSENIGRIFENIVFVELMRRGEDIYYWKSTGGKEVDFICRKGKSVESAIQVCTNLANLETRNREFEGLRLAQTELGAERTLILTDDEEETESNVDLIPLWKWLLT